MRANIKMHKAIIVLFESKDEIEILIKAIYLYLEKLQD